MTRLAYLFPAFPVFHQTFVLWEVLGLQRNGLHPRIYSLRGPSAQQQPEGRDIIAAVTYLPRLLSLPVVRANWRLLRRGPGRYLGLFVEVFKAWRTGAVAVVAAAGGESQPVTVYNRLRGWFNGQPHLYLLKSLLLVPIAVRLAEQLQADGITHLHAQWASYPATVAYVVHLISALPFSVSAHAYDIYMVPRMLPAKLQAAQFVVTCARTNKEFLARLAGRDLGEKVIVNYHGVDVGRFAPVAGSAQRRRRLTVVSCGQLERYKGMHILVEACARLAAQGIELECSIVGEGPERARLQAQIQQHGLEACVHLLGGRPHAQVAELLRSADLFVLASELAGKSRRRDVIANVIVEAMAAGLPVVASHIPGVEELVDHGGSGYLVTPNRADELAAVMKLLAERPDERARLGRAGRRRVLEDFDSSKNVRRLAALLSDTRPHAVDEELALSATGG